MTYEEIVVQRRLPPDGNMWEQQCRSDLHVNHKPIYHIDICSTVVTAVGHDKPGRNRRDSNASQCKDITIVRIRIIYRTFNGSAVHHKYGRRHAVFSHRSVGVNRTLKQPPPPQKHTHTLPLHSPLSLLCTLWAGQVTPPRGQIHGTPIPIICYSFAEHVVYHLHPSCHRRHNMA